MEENLDIKKEINSNEEKPLINSPVDSSNEEKPSINSPVDNKENDQTKLIDKNSVENVVSPDNQNQKKIVSNEPIQKKGESTSSNDIKMKPKKEIPIEKKPFNEFVNDYLLPAIISEFKERGFEVNEINLKNTSRPITGDKCWVIYCEIKDICNFWLSFEKEDISSLKSISLCKSNQKPSVIESFLIDEKRITLKLIISRILQRLNGQKLIGIN